MRINQKSKKSRKKGSFAGKDLDSDIFRQGCFFELKRCLFAVIVYKKVNYALFEAQFNSDVLTKDQFALKNVLIDKNEFDAGPQVVELLIQGKRPQGIDWLRISDQFIDFLFRELAFFGDLEYHIPFDLGKMLVGFCKLNEDVKLFLRDDVHFNNR